MEKIIIILLGIWMIAVGGYCLYYAFMMKQTGTLKTGFIVSREIQLRESRDLPTFIVLAIKKCLIFGAIAVAGGLFFIIAYVMDNVYGHALMLLSLIVMFGAYVWFTSTLRSAEKKYLLPSLKKKTGKKRK